MLMHIVIHKYACFLILLFVCSLLDKSGLFGQIDLPDAPKQINQIYGYSHLHLVQLCFKPERRISTVKTFQDCIGRGDQVCGLANSITSPLPPLLGAVACVGLRFCFLFFFFFWAFFLWNWVYLELLNFVCYFMTDLKWTKFRK